MTDIEQEAKAKRYLEVVEIAKNRALEILPLDRFPGGDGDVARVAFISGYLECYVDRNNFKED